MDRALLKMRQCMALQDKIKFTQRRIEEWIDNFGINGIYIYRLVEVKTLQFSFI